MAERFQCAPPVDYAGIFDVDIYTCPCGHVYGDHDYQHCNGTIVLGKCHECERITGTPQYMAPEQSPRTGGERG